MKRHLVPFLLGFLWILSPVRLRAQNPLPEAPTRHVLDVADALPASTIDSLDARLVELEHKSGTQVVAFIAKSLPPGEDLEDYVRRVFNEWKIGEAQRNNGVLFAVFVNDHRMRIEVGSGLNRALPNRLAARILRDRVAPRFRVNDFAGGVSAGVNSIVQAVRGEYRSPARIQGKSPHGLGLALQIWMVVAGIAGAFAGIFMRGLKTRNQPTGAQIGHTIAGGLVGGLGHPLAVYVGSEFHILAGLAVAAALWMWFFSSPGAFSPPASGWDYSGGGLGRTGWGSWGNGWGGGWGGGWNGINIHLWGDNSSSSSSGGFFGGSGSDSSSGSSSSSSESGSWGGGDSGFSGGGGSSDGGGASGSW